MKKEILVLIILINLALVSAIQITDLNTITSTSNNSINLIFNITNPDDNGFINNLTFNWNGVNTTLYDNSLVLSYNFDNRSSLGESSTIVKDLTKYGNNGTVYGDTNLSWNINNGKYNGAYNFTGNLGYIQLSNNIISINNSFTIAMWFYISGKTYAYNLFGSAVHTNDRFAISSSSTNQDVISAAFYNGSFQGAKSGTISTNTWYLLVYTWDNSTFIGNLILNNINQSGTSTPSTSSTASATIGSSNSGTAQNSTNGTIDNVMIWSRILNSNEILNLYNSQLTKYNKTNYQFSINQSINTTLLNSTVTNKLYFYNLCLTNSSSLICSNNSITQIIPNKNLISSFTSNIGTIRNDFYGIHALPTISPYGWVSNDNDCTLESYSNYTLERRSIINENINTIRIEMSLHNNANSDGTFRTSGLGGNDANISNFQSVVKWAYEKNKKILFIAGFTPEWLANKTTGWCNTTTGTNSSCPPSNYTRWGELVVDFIDNVTENGRYASVIDGIEVWNEPYGNFWLNNLSFDNQIKSREYLKLYNATYDAVKLSYPNMPVGGPSGYPPYPNMINNFLGNYSNKMDFVSFHEYYNQNDGFYDVINSTNWIKSRCDVYSANCSKIIISEWNLIYDLGYSFTNFHTATEASTYLDLLTNYSNNITSIFFMQSTSYKNTSCDPLYNYTQYSQFTNTYLPVYNITKNFATYCPSSSQVYSTSSEDSLIKLVSCKNGITKSIIVLNTGLDAKNITLDLSSSGITNLTDNYYNYTGNIINLGILDSYKLIYLSSFTDKPLKLVHCSEMNDIILTTISYLALIILTIVFATILSIVFLSIKGYFNFEGFKDSINIDWKPLLIGITIAILIISILVTLTVLFNAQICT